MPPSQLRDYQHRGLDALGELYADGHSRATLVLPCGTGKTIVAAHLIGELGARRVVVFVPTVQLLEQTLRRLAGDNPDARLLAVCSPTALDEDDLPETAAAATIDQPVTTDPDAIADTITRTSGPLIVAATYASSPKIAEATTAAGIRWGLLVCDEAHRTAGTADKAWALPLHDDAIPAHRRLAMTATTRIIDVDDDRLPTDLDADDVQIVSMDSLADYGPHVEPLTFRSAIGDNHLSDYQIAVVSVPHRRALALLSHDQQHQPSKRDLQSAAAQLALTHTAAKHGDLHALMVFHNRISQSRRWTKQLTALAKHTPQHVTVDAYHIDGSTAPSWRSRALNALSNPDGKLVAVSNCRVFSEGIDVPALDAVLFAAPRTAGPDIVQIVGRAIRPHPGGHDRKALIILPVIDYGDDPADLDTKAARTGHLAAWQVLTALAEQDELLHSSLLQWRDHIDNGAPPPSDSHLIVDTSMLDDTSRAQFTLRTVARASSPHVLAAAKLAAFQSRHGHARPRGSYVTDDGYPLGARCTAARAAYKAGRLHPRIIALFEQVPGWAWSVSNAPPRRTPKQWIDLVEQFVTKTGIHTVQRSAWVTDPDSGARANIGEWVHTKARRRGYLTASESRRLDKTLGR